MQRPGSLVRWGLLLTLLGMGGAGLLSVPPEGSAQGETPRPLRLFERDWNIEKFVSDIKVSGYLPNLAFDNAGNLYVTSVGDLGFPGDGGIQKVDAQTHKVTPFSDATDVAAVAFDAKGGLAYSTGVANAASDIFRMNRPDATIGTKIARGEFLLRMMPLVGQNQFFPEIAWSLAFGKPDDKGDQPLYVGTSPVGLGGDEMNTEGRIFRVNPDGKEIRGMATPFDVADMVIASDGSLLFADNYGNEISRVVPDGKGVITPYATLSVTRPNGIVSVPTDMLVLKKMAMDTAGNLYVIARESPVKTNVYKVEAARPRRVTLFAENLPQTMLPLIKSDAKGNLYLVDNVDTGLTIYRLTRSAR